MNEKRFFVKELERKDFTHSDALRAVRCWWTAYSERGGHIEQDYTFHIFENGITISDNEGDGFISIHDKETFETLRDLMNGVGQ